MGDFSENMPPVEKVRVLTEERDGTTTGYIVSSVDMREYLDKGGSLHAVIGGELREMRVDIIIVIDGADFVFKQHPSLQDCFLIIDPAGRQIPL